MIRQDYIMKMIEQFVKVLTKILFNKEEGNYQEAIVNIDSAFKNILGLDYNLLKVLSTQDIIAMLKISKDDPALNIRFVVIAKLLKERAELENMGEDESSDPDYQKILSLYLEGILNNKDTEIDLSNYYSDVIEIAKKAGDNLPEDVRLNLKKFYEWQK